MLANTCVPGARWLRGGRTGTVRVELARLAGAGTIRLTVRDDGAGMPADLRWPDNGNLGGKIVRSLLHGLEATLDISGGPDGARLTVDVPVAGMAPLRRGAEAATALTAPG